MEKSVKCRFCGKFINEDQQYYGDYHCYNCEYTRMRISSTIDLDWNYIEETITGTFQNILDSSKEDKTINKRLAIGDYIIHFLEKACSFFKLEDFKIQEFIEMLDENVDSMAKKIIEENEKKKGK